MTDRIMIIGGVAGGASVATRLRRLNEDAEIVIYEAGPYISFANCGLPYYVGKKIKERDQLLVESVDDMEKDFNIEVHVSSKVTKIDSDNKQLTIQTEDGEKQDQYSKLVLSTGAQPVIPNFPEMNTADNIFTVRNVPDVDQITKFIGENQAKTATVIGGGFIGLEMVENLKERGLSVNLVEATNQVMPNFDFEMAQYLHEHLQINGINLLLNTKLVGFHNNGHQVLLNNGAVLQTDLTILAIGIRPNSQLAIDAGIQTDQRGFINTDNHFETNLSDIFAIGDVINVTNAITGARQSIPLAGPANRQGRFLADYLSGIDHTNQPILGTSVAKVFALTAASTGANERQLKQAEIDYHIIHLHPNSSAGYYPGAAPIHLKILFGEDNHILGAQAIGTTKVTKRIDIISTAIRFGATVSELADIEVSYAPPYASAKDPVNFAGYIADDIQNGLVKTFQWHEVDQLIKDGNVFLDVRNPDELLAEPKLPGAINIPRSEIRDRINELPKDRPIYVYCAVGLRGYNVSRILTQNGLDARNLDGGIKTYLTATYDSMPQDSEPECSSNALDKKTPVTKNSIELDACGLQCPGPILKVKQQMESMNAGDSVKVTASDFGFYKDIEAWAKATGNSVTDNQIQGDKVVATVQKGANQPVTTQVATGGSAITTTSEGTTIVVFDGNFDKAIASLIIAQGAAAMGQPVTMFFTFWGLSVIKKPGVKVHKRGLAKAFDSVLPSSAGKLPLSKMNFLGAGRSMIKNLMHSNNVDQLEVMLQKAQDAGVKMVACTMSMGLMGFEETEFIDGVEFGGVATYLGDARQRSTNLFI